MTTWNKTSRPSSTLPIRSAPITEAWHYTKLQAALLQANVPPLYSDDVEAFKAQRLKEERRKLEIANAKSETHFFVRSLFAILAGIFLAAGIGACILMVSLTSSALLVMLAALSAMLFVPLGGFFLQATRRRFYPEGASERLEWRTYQLGECPNDSSAKFLGTIRGAGLATATVIPGEIQGRMRAIAETGVRASFQLQQLDVDPFVIVTANGESYYIGQFDETGFVR